MRIAVTLALIVTAPVLLQTPVLAASEGGHDHDSMHHEMQENHVEVMGVVNEVNHGEKKLNISHEPIPAISWPAMTMDMTASDNVDLSAIEIGAPVRIMLIKGPDGIYMIDAILPAENHTHAH